MQMCYRGVRYESNPVILDLAIRRKNEGYGVSRTQTIQTKFLGQVCHKKTTDLAIAHKRTRFLGRVCDLDLVSSATVMIASMSDI